MLPLLGNKPSCVTEQIPLLQRLTHAFRIITYVASHLVLDIRRGLSRQARQTQQGLSQAQQTIQQAVEQPAQTISQAETELKAAWARLQQHAVAGGDALMKMLHSLDKPSITLDAKWADMQEQLAGNKDVRYCTATSTGCFHLLASMQISVECGFRKVAFRVRLCVPCCMALRLACVAVIVCRPCLPRAWSPQRQSQQCWLRVGDLYSRAIGPALRPKRSLSKRKSYAVLCLLRC